jgi:hypothetical protein
MAHGLPPIFILVRDYRDVRRGDVLIRAAIAALCFWVLIIPGMEQEAEEWWAREDVLGVKVEDLMEGPDTGDHVAAQFFGWLPGSLYALLLTLIALAVARAARFFSPPRSSESM